MDDLIKRSDAIKAVKSSIKDGWGRISPIDACQNIRCLPSADRPQGEWQEVNSWESDKHSVTDMRCNICGKYASMVLPHKTACTYTFCPNCGARMKRSE